MSLLDALNTLKENNFDPKKGKEYNPYAEIPDGEYIVSLDGVTHNAKNDRDFLMITFLVVQGKFEGKTESLFPSLAQVTSTGKPMPDPVLARSIAQIQLIGEAVDTPIPDSCFAHENESDAYDDIAQVLQNAKGKLLKLTKKTRPNHKNPQYPYKNYEFEKADQPQTPKTSDDPFAGTGNTMEINDNDLPFDMN